MKGCKMGRIQSIQSFSTFDGPGTRVVVFFQGCPRQCIFCHNPDSWDIRAGEEIEAEALLRRIERFRPFLREPGLTLSGGEPLFQPDFALELIVKAKRAGWKVALDTSGWGPKARFLEIVSATDLVMFSVKHPLAPEKVSQCELGQVAANWESLAGLFIPVWLRYVLIPGWTDEPEALDALARLARMAPNLEKIEILPFNRLAGDKWAKLGWENPLFRKGFPMVTEDQIQKALDTIRSLTNK